MSLVNAKPAKLCLIYSSLSSDEIEEFLEKYGSGIFSSIKISVDKDGNETRRSLVFLQEDVYDDIIESKMDRAKYDFDFSIKEFELSERNLPGEKHERNLFVFLPYNMSLQDARILMKDQLQDIFSCDVIQPTDVNIEIPSTSRVGSGESKGFAILKFKKDIPVETIACIKMFLNGSKWVSQLAVDDTENAEAYDNSCRVQWVNKREPRENKKKDTTTKKTAVPNSVEIESKLNSELETAKKGRKERKTRNIG